MLVNIIIGIVALIIALVLWGLLYEFIATQLAKDMFKTPPGQLIDVGDHQLHMIDMGERQVNQPVVILESSVGANALDWQLVQPKIAEFARVISYDRSGNGWSEKAEVPRTPDNLADDLHQLLSKADIAPPYILVGHRYGGMYVRKYLEKYPDDVAGLILVDASHPDVFDDDNRPEIKRLQRQVRYFQPLGLVRFITKRNPRIKHLPAGAQAQYFETMMRDNPNLLAEATPILVDGIDLPDSVDVPLTLVSRAEDPDITVERQWAELQRNLATLSEDARHISTETNKNWIVFAEPETIAEAVRKMIEGFE